MYSIVFDLNNVYWKTKFQYDKFINKHEFHFPKKGYIIVGRRKINSNHDIRIKQYLMKNKFPIDKFINKTRVPVSKKEVHNPWKK